MSIMQYKTEIFIIVFFLLKVKIIFNINEHFIISFSLKILIIF